MFTFLHKKRGPTKRGFTLIEGLVLLFIFSVGVITLYKVFTLSMQYIIESKKRLAAVSLANQNMEILRNTPYIDIGLDGLSTAVGFDYIGGTAGYLVPVGLQPNDSIDTVNNISFRIVYDIYYIDDPDDGTATSVPVDDIPTDYKAVRIAVLWGDGMIDASNTSQRIELSSYFIPPHGQEGAVGGGILAINIIDSTGLAVDGATVTAWPISGGAALGTIVTGADGHVAYQNVTAAIDEYRVRVVKNDYEIIETLPLTATLDPVFQDQTVWNGILTTLNVVTDELQDFTLHTKDPFCDPIGNIDFDLYGGRILGTDPSNGDVNVYVYDDAVATNGSGEFDVGPAADIDSSGKTSAGQYFVNMTEGGYTFWRLDPATFDAPDVVVIPILPPATASSCNFIILDDAKDSLFVYVKDNVTGGPIKQATVQLVDPLSSYDVTQLTDDFGYAYFPENNAANEQLSNGVQYDITVSATDYNDDTSVHPTINGLVEETIALQQN